MPKIFNVLTPPFDYYEESNILDGTSTGQLAFWDATLGKWTYTETSELFWDDTNKRLGIGIDSPKQNLHLHSEDTGTYFQITNASSGQLTDDGFQFILYNSDVNLNNQELGAMIFRTNDLEKVRIDSNGKVGIGTDSPTVKLQVEGDIKLANNELLMWRNTADTSDIAAFKINTNDNFIFNSNNNINNVYFDTSPSYDMFFRDGSNNNSIRIDGTTGEVYFESGNVGIGTDRPSGALHIKEPTTSIATHLYWEKPNSSDKINYQLTDSGKFCARYVHSGTDYDAFSMLNLDANPYIRFAGLSGTYAQINSNGNSYFTGGNVGIGTNNPVRQFHISGSSPFMRFQNTALTNSYTDFLETQDSFYIRSRGSADYGEIVFQRWNNVGTITETARFNKNGDLGIGTASPDTKLQVVGDTKLGQDTTNYTEIKDDGEINLHGTARVYNGIWLDPTGMKAPGTKPATYVDHGITGAWEFSDGTDDTLVFNMKRPDDLDTSVAPTLLIGWSTSTTATDETCVWQLEYLYTSEGDDTTAGATETLTIDSNAIAQANGLIVAELTGINLVPSDNVCMHCRLKRLGADADDDLTDTAELSGVCFRYVKNKLGTAL